MIPKPASLRCAEALSRMANTNYFSYEALTPKIKDLKIGGPWTQESCNVLGSFLSNIVPCVFTTPETGVHVPTVVSNASMRSIHAKAHQKQRRKYISEKIFQDSATTCYPSVYIVGYRSMLLG